MTGSARAAPRRDIAAVILAAGLSSRMGALKPLLPLGEDTVLARVITAARRAGAHPIHVVVGHRAEEITPHVIRLGAIPVANPAYRTGMLSSVRAGLASLPEVVLGCLLMPVDIPLVRPTTVTRVMNQARQSAAPLIHPTFLGQRGHPPFIARRLFLDLLAADEDGGARAILARHEDEADDIPVFDEGCLRDMDTPADHRALIGEATRHHLPGAAECTAMFDAACTPSPVRRHGQAVAALATSLATDITRRGLFLDRDRIHAAAVLHDIAKGRPRHAQAGADLVQAFGFPALSPLIANHMALPPGPTALDDTAVVFLADKLVAGDRRVTLDQRFAPALERFAENAAARAGALRRLADAKALARAIETMGIPLSPPSVPQGAPGEPSPLSIREIAS